MLQHNFILTLARKHLNRSIIFQSHFSTNILTRSTDANSDTKILQTPLEVYRDMVSKGIKKTPLKLDKLRGMLKRCNEPKHLKYILKGVDIYQRKGQDFSVDTASLFIKACIRCGSPQSAVEKISVYNNRIGAWVSTKSVHLLVQTISESNEPTVDLEKLFTAIDVVCGKGVIISLETIETLLKMATDKNDIIHYDRICIMASSLCSTEDVTTLCNKYPRPIQENPTPNNDETSK